MNQTFGLILLYLSDFYFVFCSINIVNCENFQEEEEGGGLQVQEDVLIQLKKKWNVGHVVNSTLTAVEDGRRHSEKQHIIEMTFILAYGAICYPTL